MLCEAYRRLRNLDAKQNALEGMNSRTQIPELAKTVHVRVEHVGGIASMSGMEPSAGACLVCGTSLVMMREIGSLRTIECCPSCPSPESEFLDEQRRDAETEDEDEVDQDEA